MSRSSDWSVLGLSSDPTPGDPERIRQLAESLETFADDAAEALSTIRGMVESDSLATFVGLTADAFKERFEKVPPNLTKLHTSYDLAAAALATYWPKLEDAQHDADRALTEGQSAAAELASAQSALETAVAELEDAEEAAEDPDEDEVRGGVREALRSAASTHEGAEAAVLSAESALNAAKALAGQAKEARETAAAICANSLDEASDAGIPNKKWWQKLIDWLVEAWDAIVAVAKIIVAVLGVVVMIIGGPLAWVVLAAAVIVLVDTLIDYANGNGSLWDVGFAVLDCIPGFKGLTTAAGLAAGARNLGKNVRGVAGDGAGAARRDPPATSRPPESRCTNGDPVDMVSGEMLLEERDVSFLGVLPLVLRRTHLSTYRYGRFHGTSWASTLDERLELDDEGAVFFSESATMLVFDVPRGAESVLPRSGPRLRLNWDGTPGGAMELADPISGVVRHFAAMERHPAGTARYTLYLVGISDPHGNHIEIERDLDGLPTEVRHSAGYRVRVGSVCDRVTELSFVTTENHPVPLRGFAYDVRGELEGVVNESGLSKRYVHDERSRITRWEDRVGDWYEFTYDAADRCVAGTGIHGVLDCRIDYDPARRTTRYTDSLGHTTVYRYDDQWRLCLIRGPEGEELRQAWDAHGHLRSQTDALGRTTRYRHDPEGNLLELVRPDGATTTTEVNALNRPVRVVEPHGAVWLHEYDDRGLLTATTDPHGNTSRHSYDVTGAWDSSTDALGRTARRTLDPAGLPLTLEDAAGEVTVIRRDPMGRIASVTDPAGDSTHYGWTVDGLADWQEGPDGLRESWQWDAEGHLLRHTDPAGLSLELEHGWFGRTTRRTDADGTTHLFTYDTELNLLAVENPHGEQWSYAYDSAKRLVRETDFAGRSLSYRFDGAGRLAERELDGDVTRFTRDACGRVTAREAGEEAEHFVYDLVGNVTESRSRSTSTSREFDLTGRVLAETTDGARTRYTYDALGRTLTRVTPSGAESHWSYDIRGDSSGVRCGALDIGFVRDAAGREVERRLGDGAVLRHRWDGTDRLAEQELLSADGRERLQLRTYRYRADDAPVEITELDTGRRHFELDPVGRVTAVRAETWTERYGYDDAGNLVTASARPAPSAAGTAPADNPEQPPERREFTGNRLRRNGRTRYEYDDMGRVVTITTRLLNGQQRASHYTWNDDNRLTQVITDSGDRWQYRYDAMGRRVRKARVGDDDAPLQETRFTWDGTHLIEQVTSDGRVTSWDYEPGGHRPLAQREFSTDAAGGTVDERFYAIVADLTGAPAELVTPDGDVVWRNRMSLWGRRAARHGTGQGPECPLRFPGQYADEETGWHYNYERYYDPDTARYLTPDPLGLAADANQYAYVFNPLWWIDPLGLVRTPSVRGPNGRFAPNPNATPIVHNRDSEYPRSYRQTTHDAMATQWTDEGRRAQGVPVDAQGQRIPRDQLTWRDSRGRLIPVDQLSYEHREAVVDHWNRVGYNSNRTVRLDFYNNAGDMEPMNLSQNSSQGAQMTATYRQDTGPNYKSTC
ncbi:RHS repeat-associated core domain-containing protein [Streptomyces otsuchiensis]|uniref:RHS repeat-associated core domain-containing protein n=1 Tax=Streptomyces otsuchiensis TaxID=2681388 RepID=UPI0034D96342